MAFTVLQLMSIIRPWQGSSAVNLVLMEQYKSNSVLNIINDNRNQNLLESYSTILKTNQEFQKNYPTLIVQSSDTDSSFNISEVILRNRWKPAKWRFGHSVAIFSESLEFASKGFLIYGPNCSENGSIFLIMARASFNTQNGTGKFQRDVVYRKMYPKLAIITYGESCKVQVVCILCLNSLSPPEITLKDDFEGISSVSNAINALHEDYNNGKGHGSVALLCQVGFRGQVKAKNLNYHRHLEITARWRYDKTADKIGVILGIIINRFNFSMEDETWRNEQGNYSGIYLNPGGDMPLEYIYGRQLTLSYIISEFLMYCRLVPVISATGWDFLWAPLDYSTWGLVFVTGILFSFYHRGQISYGLDVFWAILSIPPNSDWSRSKVLSCSLVVLLNLNVGYLSVITSKVIIPNREADIETPAQLFQQGFRFIDHNISASGEGFMKYWGKYLEAVKINASVMSNVLVPVDPSCSETHNTNCIAKWAGLATGVLYSHEKTQKLLGIPVDMRDRCHGVKQPFRAYWVSFYSQGPLASIIYDTYQALIATGIDSFWDKLQKTSSVYDAYRKANHTQTKNGDPPKLSFKTPILVVFKAYGVLISLCIISFPIEWFYHYVRNTGRQITHSTRKSNQFSVMGKKLMLRLVMYCCGLEERGAPQPKIIFVSNFNNGDTKLKGKPRVEVLLW